MKVECGRVKGKYFCCNCMVKLNAGGNVMNYMECVVGVLEYSFVDFDVTFV